QPPETAIVCDEDDVWVRWGRRNGMLIRMQADSLCIQRHVSEVDARVLRPRDCPAIRPVNIAIEIVDLAVLIRATDVDDVGRAWWRVNGHIVTALPFTIVERSEARCPVGRV